MTSYKVNHIVYYKRDTLSQKHSQSESDEARWWSLDLWLTAARLLLSVSGLVRLKGVCSQVCPLTSFQKTIFLDLGRTCSGPTPFLAVSYSAANSGYNDCSELQMQAFLLAQQEQPVLLPIRFFGAATKRCGRPLGHLAQIQCTILLLPAVILSGSRPALLFLSTSNSVIAECLLCVKLGCLLTVDAFLEHLGQPLWLMTLLDAWVCQL